MWVVGRYSGYCNWDERYVFETPEITYWQRSSSNQTTFQCARSLLFETSFFFSQALTLTPIHCCNNLQPFHAGTRLRAVFMRHPRHGRVSPSPPSVYFQVLVATLLLSRAATQHCLRCSYHFSGGPWQPLGKRGAKNGQDVCFVLPTVSRLGNRLHVNFRNRVALPRLLI